MNMHLAQIINLVMNRKEIIWFYKRAAKAEPYYAYQVYSKSNASIYNEINLRRNFFLNNLFLIQYCDFASLYNIAKLAQYN